MNNSTNRNSTTRRWSFTLILVMALVAIALVTTAVTYALNGEQVLTQLGAYYAYLPIVFHQ